MLVRGLERRREIALSMALGARRLRIVAQTLTESILLSLLGAVAGLAVAFGTTRLILHFAFPPSFGHAAVPIDASPSMPVLVFASVISLVTGVAFGIVPAWMTTRVDPNEALRGTGRSTAGAGLLPRKTLVVLQTAVSLVLLSAAGLLTVTLHNLENQNFGFEQDRRLVASMNPRLAGYRAEQLPELYRRIHDSIASLPEVSSVALCLYSPQRGGGWGAGVWVEGHPAPGPQDDNSASWDRVTAGYFDVIGTRILKGRGISEQDTATSRHVAVINEAFARKFFKNEDPLGKHFGEGAATSNELEVVGVAGNARYRAYGLDEPAEPFFFLPEAQADYTRSNQGSLFLHDIVILTKPGANVPFSRIREALAHVDPNMPIISVRTLTEQLSGRFTQQNLTARLASFFGVLSLLLASIGLYGVTAYNAGRRINEIGVRMALGANRQHVVLLVLRGAFGLVLLGLLLGLPLAFAAGRFMGSQLYGMSPYNPTVTLIAVVLLGLSAIIASLIPALRASLISPLHALRVE